MSTPGLVDPTQPQPRTVMPPEVRQQAYQQLLNAAGTRGDNGDSSQMMADILNKVDMGRADRVSGLWANRNSAMDQAGQSMLGGVNAAYAAARARRGAGGSTAPGVAPGYDWNALLGDTRTTSWDRMLHGWGGVYGWALGANGPQPSTFDKRDAPLTGGLDPYLGAIPHQPAVITTVVGQGPAPVIKSKNPMMQTRPNPYFPGRRSAGPNG